LNLREGSSRKTGFVDGMHQRVGSSSTKAIITFSPGLTAIE
jgi:hypothetical protein